MNKVTVLAAGLLLLVAAFVYWKYEPKSSMGDAVYVADYRNSTYEIFGEKVTLKDGLSEVKTAANSAAVVATRYFGNEARGDLNGDGREDVAFLLTQSGGGSGTFYLVTVALGTEKGYQGLNTILLGDRIAPQTTEIRDGQLIVNFATRKDGEPMTSSPSVGVSKYLRVVDNRLTEEK